MAPTLVPVTIRVLVAEDNALLRDGLARLITSVADFELVDACSDLDGLLAAVDAHLPDVVVTDIRMPPTGTDEGIRAAADIRRRHPDIGVVVLSQFVSTSYALAVLDGGSDRRGYLLKDRVADVDDLVEAIRTVAAGGAAIDPKVVEQLVNASRRGGSSPLEHLTVREREVLAAMAEGRSNASVAHHLGLSERAVEKHINSIFSKLHLTEERDLNRRVSAVLVYLGAGAGGDHANEVVPPPSSATR